MDRINCIYMRVSTDMQTVESQMHALKEYCNRTGLTKYEMFIDEGISGAVENRPSLNRMMEVVESGKAERLLTFSFSRIARSTSHLLKILQKCKDHKTHLVSITEQIDTNSPMGMALFTILGALSQLERELIRERVKAGLAAAKARGKQIGRKKLRDSPLIRSLLKNGLSFRKIAVIAKCSHGSISAEKRDMLRDEAAVNAKIEAEMQRLLPAPEERQVGPSDATPTT